MPRHLTALTLLALTCAAPAIAQAQAPVAQTAIAQRMGQAQLGVLPTRPDTPRLPEIIALFEGLGLPVIPPQALHRELARRRVDLSGLIAYRYTQDRDMMRRAAEARCALRMPILVLVHQNGDNSVSLLARDPNFLNMHATNLPPGPISPRDRALIEAWLLETTRRVQGATLSEESCRLTARARREQVTRNTPEARERRRRRRRGVGELRLDLVNLGVGRQVIPREGGEDATRRTGWWALGAGGSAWLIAPRRRGFGLNVHANGRVAWPATREVSATIEAGMEVTADLKKHLLLSALIGWRGGWTGADAPTPSLRTRHPWLALSVSPLRDRFISLRFTAEGGYWLRGPLIEDPHAWWWRSSVEWRLHYRRSSPVSLRVRTSVEGVMQRGAARDLSMWTVMPGIVIRL